MSTMDKVLRAINEDKKSGKRRIKEKSTFNKNKFQKALKKIAKSKNM